jgi:hypothetical protein
MVVYSSNMVRQGNSKSTAISHHYHIMPSFIPQHQLNFRLSWLVIDTARPFASTPASAAGAGSQFALV